MGFDNLEHPLEKAKKPRRNEMRTAVLIFLTERGLAAMRNRNTPLRAEQSRAWADCALFASCERGALEAEYYIHDG